MTSEIRNTTQSDIKHIAQHLREADGIELHASYPYGSTLEALRRCHAVDEYSSRVLLIDDEPVAIGGVAHTKPLNPRYGVPWFMGTTKLDDHPMTMVKLAKRYVTDWMGKHDLLENLVWTGNHRSLRLIEILGFDLSDEVTLLRGLSFVHFSWRRGVSNV